MNEENGIKQDFLVPKKETLASKIKASEDSNKMPIWLKGGIFGLILPIFLVVITIPAGMISGFILHYLLLPSHLLIIPFFSTPRDSMTDSVRTIYGIILYVIPSLFFYFFISASIISPIKFFKWMLKNIKKLLIIFIIPYSLFYYYTLSENIQIYIYESISKNKYCFILSPFYEEKIRSKCYYDKAMNSDINGEKSCSNISAWYKNECYLEIAKKNHDYKPCKYIDSSPFQIKCLKEIGAEESVCKEFFQTPCYGDGAIDTCMMNLADNAIVCENIPQGCSIGECYRYMAKKLKDPELCNKNDNEYNEYIDKYLISECIENVSFDISVEVRENKDIRLCEKIPANQNEYKNLCIENANRPD